jgi:cytoskeletal protein CcmA (bactofilin family)
MPDPIQKTKYKMYIDGKFEGYVEGDETTVHIPAETTGECGRVEIREVKELKGELKGD